MTISIDSQSFDLEPALVIAIQKAVEATLSVEEASMDVSIALLNDEEIGRLNQQYLGHDGPTDVISFLLEEAPLAPVGDIYIGLEQARRQAEENGVEFLEEVQRLSVHGILHVLGWEHPEGDGRFQSPMFARQEEIIASFAPSAATPIKRESD